MSEDCNIEPETPDDSDARKYLIFKIMSYINVVLTLSRPSFQINVRSNIAPLGFVLFWPS